MLYLLLFGIVFATGGVIILLAQLSGVRGELMRELWHLYFLELCLSTYILLPNFLGPVAFLLAILALCLRAQWELHEELLPAEAPRRKVLLPLVTLAMFAAAHSGDEPGLCRLLLITLHLLVISDLFAPFSPGQVERIAKVTFITLYPITFLAYLHLLRMLPDGHLLVFLLFAVGETNDAFAQLLGKLLGRFFGKGKPFPEITPRKTYAGLIGGMVFGGLVGIGVGLTATPFPPAFVVGATALILLTTIVGDLVASKLKRNLGIKDFGKSPTALGGFLDLYDSLLFGAPALYWFAISFPR